MGIFGCWFEKPRRTYKKLFVTILFLFGWNVQWARSVRRFLLTSTSLYTKTTIKNVRSFYSVGRRTATPHSPMARKFSSFQFKSKSNKKQDVDSRCNKLGAISRRAECFAAVGFDEKIKLTVSTRTRRWSFCAGGELRLSLSTHIKLMCRAPADVWCAAVAVMRSRAPPPFLRLKNNPFCRGQTAPLTRILICNARVREGGSPRSSWFWTRHTSYKSQHYY